MTTPARELGDLSQALGDRFLIERELGRGGMGTVYLARDRQLDRAVAIKVLPHSLATDPTLRERFLRETRTAAGFSHPNIVPVHAVEERPNLLAFVMGYVEGESLSQRVARSGPMEAREILRLLLDVGYALAYAHGRGVVHRDVKPDNIMLERATGRALLMDFGISRGVATQSATQGMTRVGEVVGTPEYMSPEQSVGDQLDGRSDLYSLALTAYFVATGKPVFAGETTQKILMRQLSETPPSLSTLRPDLPRVLTDAVDRCLEKDPNERFEDAATLVSALEGAQSFVPDIPMPIRLFTQELGGLGTIVFFVSLCMWVLLNALDRENNDDLFVPITLLFAILLGRILQTLVDARRLMRQGFPRTEILHGLRAVMMERETRRVQLRSDAATRGMRRKTVASALFMVVSAAVLIRLALNYRFPVPSGGYNTELPGAIMFFSALLQLGLAIPLLLRSPLRMPVAERVFRLIWFGPVGSAFFRLAGLRLGDAAPVTHSRRGLSAAREDAERRGSNAPPKVTPAQSLNGSNTADLRIAALEERVALLERQHKS